MPNTFESEHENDNEDDEVVICWDIHYNDTLNELYAAESEGNESNSVEFKYDKSDGNGI